MKTKILLLALCTAFSLYSCGQRKSTETQPANEVLPLDSIVQRYDRATPNLPEYRRISPQEAKNIMSENSNVVILDVRTPQEFKESRIENAISLPFTEINERAEILLLDKDVQILVYCRRGARSRVAANKLISLGYTNVLDFGGLDYWDYGVVKD